MLFSRWGAFVYRFRRPIALLTVVLALVFGDLRGSRPPSARLGRLARPLIRIGRRREPPGRRVRRGPQQPRSCLFRLDRFDRRDVRRLPGRDRDVARPPRRRSDRRRRDRLSPRPATDALHQHRRRRRRTCVVRLDVDRRAVGRPVDGSASQIDPPAGYDHPAHRLRAADQGPGATSPRRISSAPRRCRCRSPRSSSSLVFASVVAAGHAAARRRARDPVHPRR